MNQAPHPKNPLVSLNIPYTQITFQESTETAMIAPANSEPKESLVVHLDELGIMQVEYPLHAQVRLDSIQEEYYKRLEITDQKTPLLVQLHGMTFFEVKAREFLCGEENGAITSAAAVVLDAEAGYHRQSKIFMEMFKLLNKPSFPVKIFDDKDEAIAWLKGFL